VVRGTRTDVEDAGGVRVAEAVQVLAAQQRLATGARYPAPATDTLFRAAARVGARLVAEGAAAVVIDCETSYVRLGLAEELAMQLGAPSVRLSQLRADALTQIVRTQSSAA